MPHNKKSMANSKAHTVSPSRLLTSFFQPEKKDIAIILLYGVGVGVLSLAVPVGVQTLVNTVTFGTFNQPVLFLVMAVLLGLCVAAALRTVQIILVEKFQKRFFANVALELSHRLTRTVVDAAGTTRSPEVVNRFFDVLTVQKSAALLLMEGFGLILQTGISIALLSVYHPILLAFALLLLAAIYVILFVLGRGGIQSSLEESIQKYRVAAWLEEIVARPLTFSDRQAREFALKRADTLVNDYLEARTSHFRILLRQILGSLGLQTVASAALLGLGAYLVTKGQLTIGQLVAAEIVVTTALNSLAKFQKHLEAFYDLIAALDKVDFLLEMPLERQSGNLAPTTDGPAKLELRNVTYMPPGVERGFQNLNLEIPSGSHTALLGPGGSGKSTFMDLLYALREPQSGFLLLDGLDYREINPETMRDKVVLVRGLEFLGSSILENVRAGRQAISTDEIYTCLRDLGILDDLLNLPNGLQTRLGDAGLPLSISQAQILMLARGIVGKPRLLLVDELLDGLDPELTSQALSVLNDSKAPWTLLVSTRIDSVANKFSKRIDLASLVHQGERK
jgi:putative ABC transport system ATP-binding protein